MLVSDDVKFQSNWPEGYPGLADPGRPRLGAPGEGAALQGQKPQILRPLALGSALRHEWGVRAPHRLPCLPPHRHPPSRADGLSDAVS